jgi:hypothetical protein
MKDIIQKRISNIELCRKIKRETKDCAVIATSFLLDTSYAICHTAYKESGRKNNAGCSMDNIEDAFSKLGVSLNLVWDKKDKTFNKIREEFPKGKYLLLSRNHAASLIDGKLHEIGYIGYKRKVVKVYRIVKLLKVFNESPKVKYNTIQEIILDKLSETDIEGKGLSYSIIVNIVKEYFPDAKTSKACVAWYVSAVKKGKYNIVLPSKRNRSK